MSEWEWWNGLYANRVRQDLWLSSSFFFSISLDFSLSHSSLSFFILVETLSLEEDSYCLFHNWVNWFEMAGLRRFRDSDYEPMGFWNGQFSIFSANCTDSSSWDSNVVDSVVMAVTWSFLLTHLSVFSSRLLEWSIDRRLWMERMERFGERSRCIHAGMTSIETIRGCNEILAQLREDDSYSELAHWRLECSRPLWTFSEVHCSISDSDLL